MKRKITLPVLIAVLAAQLIGVASMVAFGLSIDDIIMKNGTEYKFKVSTEGNYYGGSIHYFIDETYFGGEYYLTSHPDNSTYAQLVTDSEGFSAVKRIGKYARRPKAYISLTNENAFPNAHYYEPDFDEDEEELLGDGRISVEYQNAYITVKVWHGQALVTGMYVDGEKIEDYLLRNADRPFDFNDEDPFDFNDEEPFNDSVFDY